MMNYYNHWWWICQQSPGDVNNLPRYLPFYSYGETKVCIYYGIVHDLDEKGKDETAVNILDMFY